MTIMFYMAEYNEPAAAIKRSFPVAFLFDLILLAADFALGWTWPLILPLNGEEGRSFRPALGPLFGGAAFLYCLGLWLYRKPLASLDPALLRRAHFKMSMKKIPFPILPLSITGLHVSRLSFDFFSLIAFNSILLIAFVGAVLFSVNGGLTAGQVIIGAGTAAGILAVGIVFDIVFLGIGTRAHEPSVTRVLIVPAALLQLPGLLCLMGVVSAIVGNTVPPPLDHPTVLENLLQIPLYAVLFGLLAYPLLYAPRKVLGLPLRRSLPFWLFWFLLLISYGVRLGLARNMPAG